MKGEAICLEKYGQPHHIALIICVVVPVLLGSTIPLQGSVLMQTSLESRYDNNILDYSQYDIQRFLNNSEVHPSQIYTFDDFILKGELDVDYLSRMVQGHPGRINAGIRMYTYTRNPIKNYQVFWLSGRLNTMKRSYLSIEYRMIPDYYLRHYIDRDKSPYIADDSEIYLPCRFQLQILDPGYTHYWNNKWFTSIHFPLQSLRYNESFTEYDTRTTALEVETFYFIRSHLKIGVKYSWAYGDNVGRDTSRPSGDSDLSYRQHELTWKARTDVKNLIVWRDLDINVDFYTRFREYLSDSPPAEDVFHSGRKNWRHRYRLRAALDLIPNLDMTLEYEYEDRVVNSEHPIVIRLKEYSTTVVSAGLEYTFRW